MIDVAAGDLGSSAARKFDVEAWVPTQGAYRELTSTEQLHDLPGAPPRTSATAPSAGRRRRSRPSTARSRPPAGSSRSSRRTSAPMARCWCRRRCRPYLGGLEIIEPVAAR